MFFGRKKEKKIAEQLEKNATNQSYWKLVRKQFKENRLAVWSLRVLYTLIFIALFGNLFVNEKPLYCKIEGETSYPIFRQYLVDLGLAKWDAKFISNNWSDHDYEEVVYTLIPYSPKTLDLNNTNKSPFEKQKVASTRFHHWLGTDQLGRDTAAGLIRGTQVALIVGIVSMGVACLIGLFLGGLAGFFGDDQLKASIPQLILNSIGFFLGLFYGFSARSYTITEGNFFWGIFIGLLIFLGVFLLFNLLARLIDRYFPAKRKIALPIDLLVMRLIEIMNSIPGLVFILAILAVLKEDSIVNIMIIIGLIGWTGVARFVRSELLRVRNLDYIEAARALGLGNVRLLLRHALPNALTPVLITIAFGIAGAILTEAFLSFLGIGMPAEEITWGKMLESARGNITAWWLALFPGFAIFLTVTIFNLLGEGLTEALNPKLKQ